MTLRIRTTQVALARSQALYKVAVTKREIMAHLEAGDRDFDKLKGLVDAYVEWQHAADVLGGQTLIQD